MATQTYTPNEEKRVYAGTTMLMIGSCIGASLLALGSRFSNLGWPLSTLYMTLAVIFSFWGYRQIIDACTYTRYTTIRSLLIVTWNKVIAEIVGYATMFLIFGFLVAYCVISSDYIHSIYNFFAKVPTCNQPSSYDQQLCDEYFKCVAASNRVDKIIRAIVGCGAFMLLSFVSSVGILSLISSISLLLVIFSIGVILGRCIEALVKGKLAYDDGSWVRRIPPIPYKPEIASVLIDFPSYFSLYTLIPTMPSLYAEMKGSISEKTKIIHRTSIYATVILIVIYMTLAYVTSATFYGPNQRNYREDNILNNFSDTDKLVLSVRILYVLVIFTAFVCCLFPCRAILLDIIKADRTTKRGKVLFFVTGIIIVLLLTILAIFVPSITLVFDIITSLFGFVLYLGLPILVGLKVPVLKARREYMEARRAAMNRMDPDAELKQTNTMEAKIRDRTNSITAFLSVFGPGATERVRQASESIVRRMSMTGSRLSTSGRADRASSSSGHRLSSYRHSHIPFKGVPSTIPDTTDLQTFETPPSNNAALESGHTRQQPRLQTIPETHEQGNNRPQEATEPDTEEEETKQNISTCVVTEQIAIDHSHIISDEVLLEGFTPPKVSLKRQITLWTITSLFIITNSTSFVVTIIRLFAPKDSTGVCNK